MALTANREVDHYIDQELRSFQVGAALHIFKGALIGLAADGYARPLTAGDPFVGIAYEEVDNSGGADGAASARVYTLGDFGVTLVGATVADVCRPVFASGDDVLTFAAAGHTFVGIAQDVVANNSVILRIDPGSGAVKTAAHAVEDLSTGSDISARAMHAFSCDAWIVGARVVNQATAASGIDDSNTCVVALATGAGAVASETFDSTTPFPAANTALDFTSVSQAHVGAGSVMTIAVTNGTTANPGPFMVEVDYV